MMFSRLSAIALAALPLLAVATPLETRQDSCSTGPIQCCDQVESVRAATGSSPMP